MGRGLMAQRAEAKRRPMPLPASGHPASHDGPTMIDAELASRAEPLPRYLSGYNRSACGAVAERHTIVRF